MKTNLPPVSYIGTVAGDPQSAARQPPAAAVEAAVAVAAKLRPRPRASVASPSSTGQALAVAEGIGGEGFNSDKVEAMKAAIADGSFRINADVIAFKMLFHAANALRSGRA